MADSNRGLASADKKTREEVAQQGGNARSQDADYSELGQKGGRSQGQEDNPGNFSNRSQDEVEDIARKGGQS